MKKILILGLILLLTGCGKTENLENPPKEETEPPKANIVLNGDEKISLDYYEDYVEPGFTATNKDGEDVTSEVTVTGNVVKRPGDYTITYTYETEEESASVSRVVTVEPVEVSENASSVPVLMYHYFYDANVEPYKDANYLSKQEFEEQLKYLTENDYYFPTMQELRDYIDGKIMLPQKSIILTMDDGNDSDYTYAVPLAIQYQVPLTFFVVTSWTDPKADYVQHYRSTRIVTFESHTHDMHKAGCTEGHGGYFMCASKEDGLNDLKTSFDLLGTATALAYPFGDYTDLTKEVVKEAGFSLAFTTEWGKVSPGMDPYALPRVRVSAGNSLSSFISSIS